MTSDWYEHQHGGQGLSQCDVATRALNLPCCSPSSVNPECVRLWGLDQALGAIGHFAGKGGSPDFNTVVNQVNQGRPLGALMKYWSGIFHFVLVNGYCSDQGLVVVCDPAGIHPFSVPAQIFFGNYNNGAVWSGWYFTQ